MRRADAQLVEQRADEARIEGIAGSEVRDVPGRIALAESGKVERDRMSAGASDRRHHLTPVLGPTADAMDHHDRIATAGVALFENARAQTHDLQSLRADYVHILRSMLFYYLCSLGEERYRVAYPTGAQSRDADVDTWLTTHSGSPARC